MRFTTRQNARRYALMALACALLLIKSLKDSWEDGSLLSWGTIVLCLCLTAVVVYCGYNAVRDWRMGDDETSQEGDVGKGRGDECDGEGKTEA